MSVRTSRKAASSLDTQQKLDILLAEYEGLRAEIRTFAGIYFNMFTIFYALVLPAIGFGLQYPSLNVVFVIIPLFMLIIAFLTLFHAYAFSLIIGRIRMIEKEIGSLNGGTLVIAWEHWAEPILGRLIMRVNTANERRRNLINPVLPLAAIIAVSILSIIAYCLYQACVVIDSIVIYVVYVICIALLSSLALILLSQLPWFLGNAHQLVGDSKVKKV